ncbi:Bifunctional dethiobiotin synthetase/7,8-diamino-pelargonic acid aminotransferase, mitochondrial [Trametes pubescens]|uniref:Bifunctional dethiobiotin synthetase/7,8-diamino-pelargonic acid aminotransferase, mitochondrial n=1 Tax=Trametes pubescens TaxID=154538 RepID=A0A1M2VE10_TRAPU|nr:Bifunctional dethiobiotin synthetase/7,8-diamino-pelargonic acid aminotransferase, mitochondrial [Trametes pubescens]
MSLLYKNLRIHQVFGANTDVGKTVLTSALVRASAAAGHSVYYLKPVSTGPMSDADDDPTLSGTTQLDAYRPLFLPTVLIGDSRLGGISSTIASYEAMLIRGYIVDAVLLFRDEYYRNWEYLAPYFAERGIPVTSIQPPPEREADPSADASLTEHYYQNIVPDTGDSTIFDVVKHLDTCHTRRLEELDGMPRRTLDSIWWPFVQHGHVKTEADVNVIDSAWGDFFSVYNGKRPTASSKTSIVEPQLDGSASWWTQAIGHAHPALALAAARAAGRYGHVMFPEATHLPALKLAERLVHAGPGRGWAARAFFSDDGSTGMEVAIKMALRAYATRAAGALGGGRRKDLGILGLKGSYHGDTIGAMDACEEGVYTCEWHDAKGYWFDPPTVSIREGKTVVSLPPAIAAETGDGKADVETVSLSWTYNIEERLQSPLTDIYRGYIERTLQKLKDGNGPQIAALVLEPLVMGAGGMLFVDPLFQRVLIDAVRSLDGAPSSAPSEWSGLPVIFDEVFIGLYRLGLRSSTALLGTTPDISVNAKILTGGLVPLAVTLASDSVYRAFLSDSKVDALLHGHSYTAYPVGCEVANETLDIVEKLAASPAWTAAREKWKVPEPENANEKAVWSFWDPEFVHVVSKMDRVAEVMAFGTVLSIKIRDDSAGYESHSARALLKSIKTAAESDALSPAPGGSPFGIHYRTLGNVAYFMLSLNTPASIVRDIEERVWTVLQNRT